MGGRSISGKIPRGAAERPLSHLRGVRQFRATIRARFRATIRARFRATIRARFRATISGNNSGRLFQARFRATIQARFRARLCKSGPVQGSGRRRTNPGMQAIGSWAKQV